MLIPPNTHKKTEACKRIAFNMIKQKKRSYKNERSMFFMLMSIITVSGLVSIVLSEEKIAIFGDLESSKIGMILLSLMISCTAFTILHGIYVLIRVVIRDIQDTRERKTKGD